MTYLTCLSEGKRRSSPDGRGYSSLERHRVDPLRHVLLNSSPSPSEIVSSKSELLQLNPELQPMHHVDLPLSPSPSMRSWGSHVRSILPRGFRLCTCPGLAVMGQPSTACYNRHSGQVHLKSGPSLFLLTQLVTGDSRTRPQVSYRQSGRGVIICIWGT